MSPCHKLTRELIVTCPAGFVERCKGLMDDEDMHFCGVRSVVRRSPSVFLGSLSKDLLTSVLQAGPTSGDVGLQNHDWFYRPTFFGRPKNNLRQWPRHDVVFQDIGER